MENAMKTRVNTVELSNHARLEYFEQGEPKGVTLILLHGYVDSWHSFELVLPHLPGSLHTIAVTQRGHGNANHPKGGYSPRNFANDLLEFMDLLGLEAGVIAGGSSGGIIARRFATEHPNRTAGLILAGSPLTLCKPSVLQLWNSTISKLEDPIDPDFARGFMMGSIAQEVPREFLETMLKENLKVPARVWKDTLKGFLEDDSEKELDKIKVPTLIVWGGKDTIIPLGDMEIMIGKIEDSRLIEYPFAGHVLYWEEPARFAADTAEFTKTITG
ncbi:alpha/beta fold hydrolase [Dehalogenimonas etheniformans]|nr:alpha/beta hydrolase [Dehalogenimonas etheniformans]QNT76833.1 alpha/beta hydrolase [Dehalogenimonas etheniformans]